MIEPEYSDHLQALRYAAIEALVETEGGFNSTDLGRIFSMHRCNCAKIIKKYILEVNYEIMYYPNQKKFRPEEDYKRKVLLPDTNPIAYLRMLNQLHGRVEDATATEETV